MKFLYNSGGHDGIRLKFTGFLSNTLFLVFFGLALTVSGQAATFTVDRTDDANVSACTAAANDCTLRGAIAAANAVASNDIIEFDATVFSGTQTITLSLGELIIANNGTLTINGTGADRLNVSGNSSSRVFFINSQATTEINDLAVINGNGSGAAFSGFGAGIFIDGTSGQATLTLNRVAVSNNATSAASTDGGGIYNFRSTLNLNNSTVNGNTAIRDGGGIFCLGASSAMSTMSLVNSTISGNTSGRLGGGIFSEFSTDSATHITVANNMADTGGGVLVNGIFSFSSGNSIYADNTATSMFPDFAIIGSVTSQGHNLIEDSSGNSGFSAANDDIIGQDPQLGILQNNGGTTSTHAISNSSPAADAGNSFGTMTDQRGFPRPVDISTVMNGNNTPDAADIGAFEIQAPTPASVSIRGRILTAGGRGVARAVVRLHDQSGNVRIARTNPFGYYRFSAVEVGQVYVVDVLSKQYQSASRTVSVDADLIGLEFVLSRK